MKGKTLYDLVQSSGKSKREWSALSGVNERTLGNLYTKDVVPERYIKAFVDAGLLPDDSRKEKGKTDNVVQAYEAIIEALGHRIDELNQNHSDLYKDHYKLRGEVSVLKELLKPVKK